MIPRRLTQGLCALFMLVLLAVASAQAQMPGQVVLILDEPATQGLPLNFRTSSFAFQVKAKHAPTRLGLDALLISGSSQFSLAQLGVMLTKLPLPLTVVDLRQESHGFVNGLPVSWYGPRNWANQGENLAQVNADENARLAALAVGPQAVLAAKVKKDAQGIIAKSTPMTVKPKEAVSEAQALARRGVGYLRLPLRDHVRPTDAQVDDFLSFYRGLDRGVWLHFHCHAGKGRTTTFMLLMDILRNGGKVGLDELAQRQGLIGGSFLINRPPQEAGFKREVYQQRAEFLRNFYRYAQANPGARPLLWSQWLARRP
ncbi:MAG: phosphatase [Pseudomonadota bacterium]